MLTGKLKFWLVTLEFYWEFDRENNAIYDWSILGISINFLPVKAEQIFLFFKPTARVYLWKA